MRIFSYFKLKFSVIRYNVFAYLGLYDTSKFEDRLAAMRDVGILYASFGLSFYQFRSFHKRKQSVLDNVSLIIFF